MTFLIGRPEPGRIPPRFVDEEEDWLEVEDLEEEEDDEEDEGRVW
tara:strand:+ start:315 stop:449 length:135 start_codon:yes stop_codon:yes gene_type:complete